jgi:hypothetical protein
MSAFLCRAICFAMLLLTFTNVRSQSIGINNDGTVPNASSMLDVKSTTKGMLVPRMDKSQRLVISTPATGLLIYQNGPDSSGFYFYDGAKWNWLFGSSIADSTVWLTHGNAGLDSTRHFLGTTTNKPIRFRQNNLWLGEWNTTTKNYFLGAGAGKNALGRNNIAFGDSALNKNISAQNNVAIGSGSLQNNITGEENVAMGSNSLNHNLDGTGNTAIGYSTLLHKKTNGFNTAVGHQAMEFDSIGELNLAAGFRALHNDYKATETVALGTGAMEFSLGSNGNTAVGRGAMFHAGTATTNVAVGTWALSGMTYVSPDTSANARWNTAIGYNSMATLNPTTNSNASNNTAVGSNSLFNNSTGSYNTAIGVAALNGQSGLTNSTDNTAIGTFSQFSNTTGSGNNSLGNSSLANNLSGNNNVAVGQEAMQSDTSGSLNVAVGYRAFRDDKKGTENVAVGVGAIEHSMNSQNNTAVGRFALANAGSSSHNVAVGYSALGSMGYVSGDGSSILRYNTAVGAYALSLTNPTSNANGLYNTAVGATALYNNTIGSSNTAVGVQALNNSTSATGNVGVGFNALTTNATGSNNTAIGINADVLTNNLSNATAIGANTIVNISNAVILGNAARVGIGISSPAQKLQVDATITNEPNAGYFVSHTVPGITSNGATLLAINEQTGSALSAAVIGRTQKCNRSWGYGGFFFGGAVGVEGEVDGTNPGVTTGITYGVYGTSSVPSLYTNCGVYGISSGSYGTNYGVLGMAIGPGTNYGVFCNGNGGYSGTWTMISDIRFKKDIQKVADVLPLIKQLQPVNYMLKTDEYKYLNFPSFRQFGFVAQELEKVFPTLVENGSNPGEEAIENIDGVETKTHKNPITFKTVNYIGMIPILTKAIQEQQEIIDGLKLRLDKQEHSMNDLLRRMETVERK